MIRTSNEKRQQLKNEANKRGMTITGMIKVAVKKIFNIDI